MINRAPSGHWIVCFCVFVFALAGDSPVSAAERELDRHERPLTAKEKQEKKSWPWLFEKPPYTYSASGRLTAEVAVKLVRMSKMAV